MMPLQDLINLDLAKPHSLENALDTYWPFALQFIIGCRYGDEALPRSMENGLVESALHLAKEISDLAHLSHSSEAVVARRHSVWGAFHRWHQSSQALGFDRKFPFRDQKLLLECFCDARIFAEWLWDVDFFSSSNSQEKRLSMLGEFPWKESFVLKWSD